MARRLLVPVTLMFLVLLVLGSLTPTDSTRTDTEPTAPAPSARSKVRTVEATLPGRPVHARVGDLITLTVESEQVGGVEIPAFGESEPVAPDAPALFSILPTRPGDFAVQDIGTGERIGTLVVERGA